jgi:hypothetical protein
MGLARREKPRFTKLRSTKGTYAGSICRLGPSSRYGRVREVLVELRGRE